MQKDSKARPRPYGRAGRNEEITLAAWNPWELSNERLQYVMQDVGADVTVLTELHGQQVGKDSSRVIVSSASSAECDSAAGAAIVLSPRMAKRVMASGAQSSRVVWCRLEGLYCNLFVIGAYVAHQYRVEPSQEDVWCDIVQCAKKARKGDCLVLMGDMNGKLAREIEGYSGKYCMHPRSNAGGELMLDFMKMFSMRAVSTDFKPKKGSKYGNATYLPKNPSHSPTQIDYILVSQRWATSVTDSKVRWAPSIHRFCHKFDHGMVTAKIRHRLRKVVPRPQPFDFSKLKNKEDAEQFDSELTQHIQQYSGGYIGSSGGLYDRMITCVNNTIEKVVPRVVKKRGKVRERSERSKGLFVLRERVCEGLEKGSQKWRSTREKYTKQITASCREDWREYVLGLIDEMVKAAEVNDAKTVSRLVNKIIGKKKFSNTQPTVGKGGEAFGDAKELVEAWSAFAEDKFAATEREADRGEMPEIGERSKKEISDEDLLFCLKALKNCKAAGKDEIPAEVYKSSAVARELLFEIVRMCWRGEDVSEELVQGVFVTIYKNKGSSEDFTKYRFICLLNHSFKLLSAYLLLEFVKVIDKLYP